jgi:hypothetical protein
MTNSTFHGIPPFYFYIGIKKMVGSKFKGESGTNEFNGPNIFLQNL